MRQLLQQSRAGGTAALLLAALGALALLGALLQDQFGVFGNRVWPLPRAAGIKVNGLAYSAHLPPWGRGALAERRAILLQDGRPVGDRVRHARTVVSRGNGAYKIQRNYLYFSLPGNADPRPLAARLALALPRPVNPVVWLAGAACLLTGGLLVSANRPARLALSAAGDRLAALRPGWLIAAIFAGALAAGLARLPDAISFSDGYFSIRGVPHTDASGWDELAIHLAEGSGFRGGFTAQRPLYPVMLASVYAFTGHSLLAAKVLNAVWLAVCAAAVGAIGILGGSRIAGVAGAAAATLCEGHVTFSKLLLTETAGTTFAVGSVLALALALHTPAWWRIALAALLLACANLTSGFGLFALVGYGLVALAAWRGRLGWGSALGRSVVLAGGVALVWTPWILRQHAVHDVWNLATSNATLMYAAAVSKDGRLDARIDQEWAAAGIPPDPGPRYKFYMRKFAEAVKADPATYRRNVLRGISAFADYWIFAGPDRFGIVLLALLLVALAQLREYPLRSVLPASALVIGGCLLLNGSTALLVWPLASVLTLLTCARGQRPLWALVVLTPPFVAALGGVVGGHLNQRLWTACEWTLPLLLIRGGAGGMHILARWMTRRAAEAPTPSGPGHAVTGVMLPSTVLTLLLAAQAVFGSVLSAGLYLHHAGRIRPIVGVPPEVREAAMAAARVHHDFLKAVPPADPRFRVSVGEFGDYICHLDAGDDEQHFIRAYAARPYPRSVAQARVFDSPGGSFVTCQLRATPDKAPRRAQVLIIGVDHRSHGPSPEDGIPMIEVLGLAPLPPDGARPDWNRATWFPATDEARRIITGAP